MKTEGTHINLKYAFIVLVTLISSRFWSFHGVPEKIFDVLELFSALVLIVIVLWKYYAFDHSSAIFKTNVGLFIFIPIISLVSAALFHDQAPQLSLLALRTNFVWLLYFTLHIFDIPTKFIIRLMTVIGVVWAALTIGQQFTYPTFFFYTRNGEDGQGFFRAGMYRFMLDPHHFGLFLVVYYYCRYLVKKKITLLIYVFIGLLGFYYFATRQFAVGAVVCMILASITQPGVDKLYPALVICSALLILVIFKDYLFGSYIEMTNTQISSGDDIRIYAARYFLFDYWPNWVTVITGNGFEHMNSPYGREIKYLNETLGYYKSDIGLIGALNTYGIFYVINILWTNIKGLHSKYYTKGNYYLKLIFINSLALLFISEYYSYPSAIPFFCFILYLTDKSYEKVQQQENT